jgi:hypothetical protein
MMSQRFRFPQTQFCPTGADSGQAGRFALARLLDPPSPSRLRGSDGAGASHGIVKLRMLAASHELGRTRHRLL